MWLHKSCTVAPNTSSTTTAGSLPQYKSVYQDTCTKQNVPDNSETHMSFQYCGLSVWDFLHATLMAPRIWRLIFDF